MGSISALAMIAFFPGLGHVHLFDWDEINFAEAAREMLVTGNYGQVQINFEPFYEKPPLFFWLQAWSMRQWGINEFAARFPNACCGVVTLLTLYLMGKAEKDARFGLLWALTHLSALLPHFYFKTGIIDPVFNYLIFLSIYAIVKLYQERKWHLAHMWACGGGLAIGASILTKGPVGLLIIALVIVCYGIRYLKSPLQSWRSCLIYVVSGCSIPAAWLSYETYQHGNGFITYFLANHIDLFSQPVAGHGQPFYYHFMVVALGCFPASILAMKGLAPHEPAETTMQSIMRILFWLVMILFSLVTTKIIHYSSLVYFPVSFIAADYLYHLAQDKCRPCRWMQSGLWILAFGISMVFITLPILACHKDRLYSFIHDAYTLACIDLPVNWRMKDCVVGCSYLMLQVIGLYALHRGKVLAFLLSATMATTCCLNLATRYIIPKIEQHLQGPAIGFYQQLAGQAVFVTTVGFKSYAPFFYAQQMPTLSTEAMNSAALITTSRNNPTYFVTKVDNLDVLASHNAIKLLYTKGGFAFWATNG